MWFDFSIIIYSDKTLMSIQIITDLKPNIALTTIKDFFLIYNAPILQNKNFSIIQNLNTEKLCWNPQTLRSKIKNYVGIFDNSSNTKY